MQLARATSRAALAATIVSRAEQAQGQVHEQMDAMKAERKKLLMQQVSPNISKYPNVSMFVTWNLVLMPTCPFLAVGGLHGSFR